MFKIIKSIFFLFFILLLGACTQENVLIGNYQKEEIFIETGLDSKLDTTSYELVDVVSLCLPKSISAVKADQIKMVGDRIYILDSEYCRSLLAFKNNGEFLRKFGDVGHAKNEYIEKPTSFMVDVKTGNVHVYERASVKVLVFDKDGNVIRVKPLRPIVPGAVELLDNGKYLMCFEGKENGNGEQLAIYEKNEENDPSLHSILKRSEDGYLSLIGLPFFKEKDISYNPLLSDSIIVFSGDTVKKVIKCHFDCKFNSEETMKKCINEMSYLPLYDLKDGVQFIDNVEVTDSLVHVSYVYNQGRRNFVYNISNKKKYNGVYGTLFAGVSPCSDFTISGNKLVFFITDEDIDLVKANKLEDSVVWENSCKLTPKIMLDIVNKKIPTPVIVTIRLK